MKKLIRESINDEDEYQGSFTSRDSWDHDAIENIGLTEWLADVQRLAYELNNCRRGAYSVEGNTAEDLLNKLHELQNNLNDIVNEFHNQLES